MKVGEERLELEGTPNQRKALEVGFFLAYRDLKRANIWTTILIVAVMMLTFLNLVVVSGILVGLIEGSESAVRGHYTGDVLISTLNKKLYIEKTNDIIEALKSIPEVKNYSARFVAGGAVQANYKTRTDFSESVDEAQGLIAGIDPIAENRVTNLSKYVIEGNYLEPSDYGQVMLGAYLLYDYIPIETPGFTVLKNVKVGSRVRILVNGVTKEVTVKGIIKSKVDENDRRVFMNASELRNIIGRSDNNVDEISITLDNPMAADKVKTTLLASGFGENARVQTWLDAQPKFLKDIKTTFALLGNIISSIGLAVASITIFIVIFVNAITRRRYIGIMKGIGIDSKAIEFSYILQSVFYAFCGMMLGILFVFGFLKPFIAAHPINFPFSDGILVATVSGTMIRGAILMFATIIAGYIPARIVVKQNTLDAILGR